MVVLSRFFSGDAKHVRKLLTAVVARKVELVLM